MSMHLFEKIASLYPVVSLGLLAIFYSTDSGNTVYACPADGQYYLYFEEIEGCDGVDSGFPNCNCAHQEEGTIYSGWTSKLAARGATENETPEDADPDGGLLPCTKTVTCEEDEWQPLKCTYAFGGLWTCEEPVTVTGCDSRSTVTPISWQSISQASTCD